MKYSNKAVLAVLAFILILAGAFRPGQAQPKDKVLSVSPSAVKTASRAAAELDWFGTQIEFYFLNLDFEHRYDEEGNAPLYLPDRERIKSLIVYYMDRGCAQAQDMVVTLVRQNLLSGQVQSMAEVTSRGLVIDPARKTLEDKTINHGLVDNRRFSYSLVVKFNYIKHDRVRFHGAEIIFE